MEEFMTGPRMSLTNISTGERIEAQFNPTSIQENITIEYSRQQVLGMSHQPLQYKNTGNQQLPLELYWRSESRTEIEAHQDNRKFLYSLCYPRSGATNVVGGAPPRVLIVWPNYLSLTCVVTGLSIRAEQFNNELTPVKWSCSVALEEIRDVRLTSEEVRASGLVRSSSIKGNTEK